MSKTMKVIISLLLVVVISLSFGAGYLFGDRSHAGPSEGLHTIEQVWNIIFSEYVGKDKLDPRSIRKGAIEGMMEALDDPYSSYLDSESYQLSVSRLEGEFDGIGAVITMTDEQLTIIAPIADSPADKAGIRAGDIILEINGQPTAEIGLAEAVLRIRGPSGTPVNLLILHQDDSEPEEIEIIRATVELTSVNFEMKETIAYIHITQFSERTDEELAQVIKSISEEGAEGIIIDLRHNPGGLLQAVVEVASYFLEEGTVVKVVSEQEKISTLQVKSGKPTTALPIIVLVDNYSASGSEVLAGALQDHDRAVVAGNITFGKGSVNILHHLDDGSGLYITTARWLTPDGRLIEGEGIEPDIELELDGNDAIEWAIAYLKDGKL
ncbi:S41 family peptidase [Chloroflexota bacterium]